MQDEIRDVRARPSGRALRRVLPVGLLTMLVSPVLIVWEVYALLLMGLVALVWPAWRARSTDVRWGMLLGVRPYLAFFLVQVVFLGFGDYPRSGFESPSSSIWATTSTVVSSG